MATKSTKNDLCQSSDLGNEASVESFFVLRLLHSLEYDDKEIKTKAAIGTLQVAKGRSREPYKPDYILVCKGKPRWLIDAKSTTERIEDYTYQCASYSLQINSKFSDRPLRYYMLTNGLLTRVYVWDQEEAILSLRFKDLVEGNRKYEALKNLLRADAARTGWVTAQSSLPNKGHKLERPSMDEVKKAFSRCHRIIWKTDKMGRQAAFIEFAKLMFVKLWEDRKIRDNPDLLAAIGRGDPVPASEVRFSTHWIESQEANDPHPVNGILFRQLVDFLESEIEQRRRKRIFESGEQLRLSSGSAKRVVRELEHYYLFGIDEDLNGRMFEAFLSATMRGEELGQYFTPRSIVKLMVRLAKLKAQPGANGIERVLDACCGTGGFLIEILTEMRRQVWDNKALTQRERDRLLNEVANQAIFGIDAGRDPAIARIARINMYLHGDGGSRVYMADALKNPPEPSTADTPEVRGEVQELRTLLEHGCVFDAVLTNPPFSMDLSRSVPEEAAILDTYELASYDGKKRQSLRSAVMFMERYLDLLKPGGRMLTVIDDSILGSDSNNYVRNFLRANFIIRGIISLHGDAFQRAGARVKTSILYMTKKNSEVEETQPSAFVFESRYVGRDDVVPKTPPSVAAEARRRAMEETDEIGAAFDDYLNGRAGPWLVPTDDLSGRLDAKYLRPWRTAQLETTWRKAGIKSAALGELVAPAEDFIALDPNTKYTFIRVTYSGECERGEVRLGKEIGYAKLVRAKPGDLIISGLGAVYRAICVLPEEMTDLVISSEFLVLRRIQNVDVDTMYLWSVLRSTAVVAEWLSTAQGLARHRLDWNILKLQRLPLIEPSQQVDIGDMYRKAIKQEQEAKALREKAFGELKILDLECEAAKDKMIRAKPPK